MHVSRVRAAACAVAMTTSLLMPNQSRAAAVTGTITVTATVLAVCTITAAPLVFGNYASTTLDATTTLLVLCTPSTTYDVGLSVGSGTGATVAARKMTNGVSTLNYGLYTDPARTVAWGHTTGTDTLPGAGNGLVQTLTVYGRIPANQFVGPGVYTDVIVATVTY